MNQNSLKFKDNPYQYTRGVRFRAEPQRQGKLFKEKSLLKEQSVSLAELGNQLLDFHSELRDLLFYPEKGKILDYSQAGSSSSFNKLSQPSLKPPLSSQKENSGETDKSNNNFCKDISVNKSWLKSWHKDIFYLWLKDNQNKQGKYPLNNLFGKWDQKSKNKQALEGFAQWDLKSWIDRWGEKSLLLKSFAERSQNEKIRHSEIAETIRFFLDRGQWDYIDDFLTELNARLSRQDERIQSLKESLKSIRGNLKSAESCYLSSQSSGIEIAKASFNYYTLNKKPKEYYENKLLQLKQELKGNKLNRGDRKAVQKTMFAQSNLKEQNKPQGDEKPFELEVSQTKEREQKGPAFSIIKKIFKQNKIYYLWEEDSRDKNKWAKVSGKGKNKKEIFSFKSEQEKRWIKEYILKDQNNKEKEEPSSPKESSDSKSKFVGSWDTEGLFLSLEQTYIAMKAFKSEQKSIFYEVIAHIAGGKAGAFKVQNPNHILKGFELSFDKLKFEVVNKEFSLFEFNTNSNFYWKNKIDKIFSNIKNNQNQGVAEKAYEAFLELTKKIQQEGNIKNQNLQAQKKHPKNGFLASSINGFHGQKDFPDPRSKENGQSTKQERGAFLGKHAYFKKYGDFCNTYKRIAKKRGQLIAQVKGIEREQTESQQIDFWSFIFCDRDKKQLWLVPKQFRQSAKDFIDNSNRQTLAERQALASDSMQYLCYFESLTMRALHKLCFAEQSSFISEMSEREENLKQLHKTAKEFKTGGDKEKLKKKNQKQLEFFKELLRSNYAKERLQLDSFNLKELESVQNLEEFEKALEKACYHIKKIMITEKGKKHFLKEFDVTVLDISSYDLEARNKNTYQSPSSPNRLHTDWWRAFWIQSESDKITSKQESLAVADFNENSKAHKKEKDLNLGRIRLNPEVKIRYRTASEDLKKYFLKKKFSDSFKNRGLKEQWTAHFTLALNAGKKYEDIAFAKPEELLDKIKSFNQSLNKEMDFKTAWKYGIDRGQKELSTLCLAKFDPKDTYLENGKNILKPKFPNGTQDIKCWTLQNYKHSKKYITKKEEMKERYAVKNLSYFVDDNNLNNKELFKKENTTCLDLTTAKVIKGRIITNGDVLSYLKLKKAVAKRKLYELYHKAKIEQKALLSWEEWKNGEINNPDRNRPDGVLNIKTSNGEETIYWYQKRYEGLPLKIDRQGEIEISYTKVHIQQTLNFYLKSLGQKDNSHTPSILQINHLRDALTANMVGVISHLQKQYPGFIILENLSKGQIDKHFFNSNENISRRLENALYNKFQTLGLVPPHIKDIIRLREASLNKNQAEQKGKKDKFSQIGAIVFVDEANTSKTCPYCENVHNNNQGSKKRTANQQKPKADKQFDKQKSDSLNVEKFKQNRFLCKTCGFDTYFFKPEEKRVKGYSPKIKQENHKKEFDDFKDLDENDKVASYNIAKKSLQKNSENEK